MTNGQSASLSWNKAPTGGYDQIFITVRQFWFVDVGRSLWREDGSVVYNCRWTSPVQSFSGPSVMGLVTILYCLGFETSLSVTFYDSQGYGEVFDPASTPGKFLFFISFSLSLLSSFCSAWVVNMLFYSSVTVFCRTTFHGYAHCWHRTWVNSLLWESVYLAVV
jgi:hypothetical protein